MGIEASINELLSIDEVPDTQVPGASGKEVWPVQLPEEVGYPAIVYQRIGTPTRRYSNSGDSKLPTARFQVSIFANTYDEALALAILIQDSVSGFRGEVGGVRIGSIFVDGGSDGNDPESGHFTQRFDLLVTYEA